MKDETPDRNELRALRGLLSRLPDAPMPSNFAERVMQAVEREETRSSRKWNFPGWNWRALLPRFAVAAAVMALAGFAIHQQEIDNRRAEIAKSVVLLASAQQLPSVEALKNFDAIQRMSQPAHADEELLALAPDLK